MAWEMENKALMDDLTVLDPENPVIIKSKAELAKRKKELEAAEAAATVKAVQDAREFEKAERERMTLQLESTLIPIKKGESDKLRVERDGLQKLIQTSAGGSVDINAALKTLQPQRNTIDQINTTLNQMKVNRELDGRVKMRGQADAVANTNLNKKLALSGVGGLMSFFGRGSARFLPGVADAAGR